MYIYGSMSPLIYFCGSIRGGRQDAELYTRLIKKLQEYGKVLTEHIGINDGQESEKKLTTKAVHDRDMQWLKDCDVVVAEVTQPSLGVGYEIGRAVAMEKQILCLYRPNADKSLSCMVDGAHNDANIIVKYYKEADVDDIFSDFLKDKVQ